MRRLFRRLAGAAFVVALLAPLASAQAPEALMPGVTYEQYVDHTSHGPVAYSVITAPAPTGLTTIGPVMSGNSITGPRLTVTQLERSVTTNGVVAGVNGDFFTGANAVPAGIVISGGALWRAPTPGRSSIGFDASGNMHVGRISFSGTWKGTGQRRPIAGINQQPKANQTVLFTPAWGATTPSLQNAALVVLEPFPKAAVNTDLTAPVAAVPDGQVAIPPDGAVLVATGTAAAKLQAEASADGQVTVRLILPDAWSSVVSALGGGPQLVKGGKALFKTGENLPAEDLATRLPRTAVGQLSDGSVILVTVDGGRPGYSVGMTAYELARTMAKLGAVTAAGLEYGSSVTAAFDGKVLNRPSGPSGEQRVKEALLVQYAGVYAPPPSVPVLTSKSEASAGEQLSYRLTRPSTVTAAVVGPDGASHPVESGPKDVGTYSFTWNAIDAEGTWHWVVQATDDLNRTSTADQPFRLDLTLSGLTVSSAPGSGVKVAFTLSRPASVALEVTGANGTLAQALPAVSLPAGPQTVSWDGTTAGGVKAPPGSYVAGLTVTSAIGTASFEAPFRLQR
jgi:exopolysaccharide biosynthesis protein